MGGTGGQRHNARGTHQGELVHSGIGHGFPWKISYLLVAKLLDAGSAANPENDSATTIAAAVVKSATP